MCIFIYSIGLLLILFNIGNELFAIIALVLMIGIVYGVVIIASILRLLLKKRIAPLPHQM